MVVVWVRRECKSNGKRPIARSKLLSTKAGTAVLYHGSGVQPFLNVSFSFSFCCFVSILGRLSIDNLGICGAQQWVSTRRGEWLVSGEKSVFEVSDEGSYYGWALLPNLKAVGLLCRMLGKG